MHLTRPFLQFRILSTQQYLMRLLLTLLTCYSVGSQAQGVTLDPTQSISYWKSSIIQPQQNPSVAQAQSIFSTLLRGWDNSRVSPELFVVKSDGGP